jgi:BirA family transcriptional regulator, biotin operon repressor / biotin---[acetyl-CoA-carboxylase] ligase
MDQSKLESLLSGVHLGGVRYYPSTGSTNDDAARWSEEGAPDAALVAADTQTAGRGRGGRTWFSPPGASLSFSLVFYPSINETQSLQLFTALGALPVCLTLEEEFGLEARIKWPNDVLVERKKICGVLAEARWTGNHLSALILGVGINVARESTHERILAAAKAGFPAVSLEEVLGYKVDRFQLLRSVLVRLIAWRKDISSPGFLKAWEERLAFKSESVQIVPFQPTVMKSVGKYQQQTEALEEGTIAGLSPDGSLRLVGKDGDIIEVTHGEVHLRPLQYG